MVVLAFHLSTAEAGKEESLSVRVQLGLYNEFQDSEVSVEKP